MKSLIVFALATAGALFVQDGARQSAPTEKVGPLPDGGFLLNSGWTIRPAGEQVPVDTFPMSSALSKDGKYLLVLNGGYNPPSISVIDVAAKHELGRTPLPDCWLGLTFSPGGTVVYVGGGSSASVYELSFDEATGALARTREFRNVSETAGKAAGFIGDVAVSPDAHLLYAADLYNDSIAVVNLQSGQVIDHWKTGRRPYRILVAPGGKQLVVSSWADASVYQHDANSGAQIARTRVAPHPTDMVWLAKPAASEESESHYIGRVFVAAANTNSVYSLGVTRDGELRMLESINVSLTPLHPLGMTPSALAIDESGTHLYVACSDANAVAVADISGEHTSVLGFIPTGWYPTAVRVLEDNQVVVLNGKGLGSHPNPNGPVPTERNHPLYEGGPVVSPGYVAHIQTGTVAFIPPLTPEAMQGYNDTVRRNSPYRDEMIYGPITRPTDRFLRKNRRACVSDSARHLHH